MTYYKGYEIIQAFRHGYYYYKIAGEKKLYTRLTDVKREIDEREEYY